jgi:hypothetical protein
MEGEIVGRKKRLLEGGKDSLKSDSAAETTEKMVVVGEIVGAVIEKKFLEESETETETVTVATADGESVEISSSELKLTGAPGPQPPSLLPANTPENHRKYFDFGLNAFGNHEGPDDCNYVALTDEQAEAADAEGNPNKRKLWMLGYSQGLVNEGFMAGKYGKAIDTNNTGKNTLLTGGQWDVPKDTSTFSAGDAVYWDNNGSPVTGTALSGCATSTASGNNLMGFCSNDAATGDSYVRTLITSAKRTTTIAGSVTADDITGSDSSLGIAGKAGNASAGGAIVSLVACVLSSIRLPRCKSRFRALCRFRRRRCYLPQPTRRSRCCTVAALRLQVWRCQVMSVT